MLSLFQWEAAGVDEGDEGGQCAGRERGAAQSCSPGHLTGDVLKSEFLSLYKNINN